MFSSKQQLRKRTPENGTDRESFLTLLVDEYLNTNSNEAKYQVLANLANFGYDPVNFDYIRRVGVLDIFLYVLKNETNTTLLHFACAGICNLCIGETYCVDCMMRGTWRWAVLAACLWLATVAEARRKIKRDDFETLKSVEDVEYDDIDGVEPCQCGVFMSQQVGIKEGRRSRPRGPPQGEPVVTYDTDAPSLPCGSSGFKHCISKCLDVILKYLPRAGPVICGAVERDVHREKAFLFIKNCGGDWTPTNFSAGKEFCCTDGQHHKC